MNHFSPDGSGLPQDDSAPNHRVQELIEWFDEDETDVNHTLWPSNSADLAPVGHVREISE